MSSILAFMENASICTILVLLILWISYRWRKLSYFIRHGIPGPTPNFFWGNLEHRLSHQPFIYIQKNWIQKYGRIIGFYTGLTPTILISDAAIANSIMTKNFRNFYNRPDIFFIFPSSKMLFALKNEEWKKNRKIFANLLGTPNVKKVFHKICEACTASFDRMKANSNSKHFDLNIFPEIQLFALDVISRCTVNTSLNACQEVDLSISKLTASDFLDELLASIHAHHEGKSPSNENVLLANSVMLFLNGYETISNALGFIIYLLAKNTRVQSILFEEIDRKLKKENPTFDDLSNLPYLDVTIKECLRIFPPVVSFIIRNCKESIVINDFKFPKNVSIMIDVFSMHHDNKIWGDPEELRPERFLKDHSTENFYFLPFGKGPRQCVASNFAFTEIKIFVIKFLQRFQCTLASTQEEPIPLVMKNMVSITLKEGLTVTLKERCA